MQNGAPPVAPSTARDAHSPPGGEPPFDRLIARIVEVHHARLRAQLREAEASLGRDAGRDRTRAKLLERLRRFRREQEAHLAREERVLFPLIEELQEARRTGRPPRRRSFGPLRYAIEILDQDHALAARYLERLREDAARGPEGLAARLGELDDDLKVHIGLEDELFGRAIALDEA